jgi:hypothetical protein
VALATALSVSPLFRARAFTVVVLVTVKGPAYTAELPVGAFPFVV